MKEDKNLEAIEALILKANEINDKAVRKDAIQMIWSTLVMYINGSYRKICGEEKLLRDCMKRADEMVLDREDQAKLRKLITDHENML